jgi:6-phosphofructokinase 1
VLATQYGVKAAELCRDGKRSEMVALRGNEIVTVLLSEVGGKMRLVDLDHPLLKVAENVGTCLGR